MENARKGRALEVGWRLLPLLCSSPHCCRPCSVCGAACVSSGSRARCPWLFDPSPSHLPLPIPNGAANSADLKLPGQ